jgi:hypothetical protein
MSSFDWYLDRVVHFERPDTLTVDHDVAVDQAVMAAELAALLAREWESVGGVDP